MMLQVPDGTKPLSTMQTDLHKSIVKDVITKWPNERQEEFLKIHYALKNIADIISFWKEIYVENNRHIKMKKEMFDAIVLNKSVSDSVSKKTFSKSATQHIFCNYEGQKLRIIEFLIIGLSHNYIDISLTTLSDIISSMKSAEENTEYINAMTLHLHQLKIYNKPPKRRSISTLTINDVIHKSVVNIEKSISARPSLDTICKDFFDISSADFAIELSVKFSNIISSIRPKEIILAALYEKNYNIAPNYNLLVKHYIRLTHFVYSDIIINRKRDKDRIKSIKKFLEIAEKSLELHNYLAFYGIISALANTTIQRIKTLWKTKSRHTKKQTEFEKLIYPGNNSAEFRKLITLALEKNGRYIIPNLALIVSDIRHLLENDIIDPITKDFNWKTYNCLLAIINSFEKIKNTNFDTRCNNTRISDFIDNVKICLDEILLDKLSTNYVKNNIPTESIESQIKDALDESSNSTKFDPDSLQKSDKKATQRLRSPRRPHSRKSISRDTIKSDDCISSNITQHEDTTLKEKYVSIRRTSMDGTTSTITTEHHHRRRSKHKKGDTKHLSLRIDHKSRHKHSDRKYRSTSISIEIDREFITNLKVEKWSIGQVSCWLEKIGMEKYILSFQKQEINGFALVELSKDELKNDLGVEVLGHRITISKHIDELRQFKKKNNN